MSSYPAGRPISLIQVKTILWVAIAAVFVITPFSINNLIQHRYLLGFGSLGVILILISNAWICLRGRYYPFLTLFGLVPAIIVFLGLAIHRQGMIGALWCYPAVISFYFMLPERQAWIANITLLAMAIPFSWFFIDAALAARVTATLLCVSVFSVIFVRVISAQQQELHELAMTDALTGLSNRVLLHGTLEHAVQQHERRKAPMTLVTLDLDHFKDINDNLGHAAGDKVLRGIGKLLLQRIRRADKVFRLGGEEFLILLYDTNAEDGWRVAEELRQSIEAMPLLPEHIVTTSIGVATLEPGEHWRDWMKRSDENLYRAKKEGRNRIVA
ncbi:GGDEF domain-containing protein [Methylophaga sp. OBS4]|uniref:GGDEF domain-containing protein n=1 Tax=Methylophaga sp. OBS4 TaxID=2991935 RepID=UPI00225A10D8|nr:GGDEF domain-containing protein [Methylophaga sp. OBS4]MCX4186557.1 GGDEF domain-containing protein [Methylophaga sp. OBS4]